jgi:hypothetical protein
MGSAQFSKSFSAGLKIEELDKPVEDFFEDNDSVYQLLSICLFEVRNFGGIPLHPMNSLSNWDTSFNGYFIQ